MKQMKNSRNQKSWSNQFHSLHHPVECVSITYCEFEWAFELIMSNMCCGQWIFVVSNNHWVCRTKCRIFPAEWNCEKQISPLNSSFKIIPVTCDHTLTPCNPVVENTHLSFRGDLIQQFSQASRKLLSDPETGAAQFAFRANTKEKSDSAISEEYWGFATNLITFCDTKWRMTLAVWHCEISTWMNNSQSLSEINRRQKRVWISSIK
jgi:hypothetical protein